MTDHILSKVPILGALVDERFLEHRRRASSIAGFATLIVAGVLFEYRFFADHIWSWDLLAVILTFGVVKMCLFLWYRFHD